MIRVVLGIVLYLEVLLVLRGFVQVAVLGDVVAEATLLAGLVPNGLFVSIAVAYALGAIRIIRFGALVQQSNAIESLSHVDVLCLDKTGTLTANRLEVEAVEALDGPAMTSLHRRGGRRWPRAPAPATRPARRSPPAWPTAPGPLAAEVPFSSARKWSAVAFDAGRGACPGRRAGRPHVPPRVPRRWHGRPA